MKQSETMSSLEPNLSSILATSNFQQVAASICGDQMSLLRMTICEQAEAGSGQVSSFASHSIKTSALRGLTQQQDLLLLQQQQHQLVQVEAPPLTKLMLEHVIEPMQYIDSKLDYYFSEIWTQNSDERSSSLPFMSGGPWKLIYLTLIYLYLIKWLLPKLMKHSKALELNWCIRFYNLLMVLSNLYAFYHGARILDFGIKCFGCEVINHKDYSPQAMELLHYGWLFFLSRLVEWLDTVFFVLRKKERQVSKLHVFHHSFVPILCWTYLKFHPGYTVAFFPLVNTFVHTIMYTYYLLATFGPSVQAYLWWKKYLTSLQITQFVLILIQLATIPLSSNEMCQYPRGFLYVAIAGAFLFLWLFYTYYIDTYKRSATNKSCPEAQRKSSKVHFQLREGSSTSLSDSIDNAIDDAKSYSDKLDSTIVHRNKPSRFDIKV